MTRAVPFRRVRFSIRPVVFRIFFFRRVTTFVRRRRRRLASRTVINYRAGVFANVQKYRVENDWKVRRARQSRPPTPPHPRRLFGRREAVAYLLSAANVIAAGGRHCAFLVFAETVRRTIDNRRIRTSRPVCGRVTSADGNRRRIDR